MALVKKSTLSLKPTVNSKITTTNVTKPAIKQSTPIKKPTVTLKTSSSEGITTVKPTTPLKSTSQSAVPSASTKMTAKLATTPRPSKTTVPVKQAADSTSTLKLKSAVKPAGKTPSVPVKTSGVVAKPTLKITAPTTPVKKAVVPATKSLKVAKEEPVGPRTKPAITTKVSTLKSPTSTTPVKTRSSSITSVKSITSITSVKSLTAPKSTKPVGANRNSTSTILKSSTAKPTSQLISKSTKSTLVTKTTLKPSTAVKSVGKVMPLVTKTVESDEDVVKEQQDVTRVEIRDADSTTIEEITYVSEDSQKCDENGNFKQESEVDEERVYAVAEQLIGVMQQLHKDSYVINMSGVEMEEPSIESGATPTEATEEESSDHEQTSSDVLAYQLPVETDTTTDEKGMFESSELKIPEVPDQRFNTDDIFEEMVKVEDEHIEEYSNTDPQEDCEPAINTMDQYTELLPLIAKEDEGAEGPVQQDIMTEAEEETTGQDFTNNEETNLIDETYPSFNVEMPENSPEASVCEDSFSNDEETNLLEESLSTSFNAETIENLSEISVCSAVSLLNENQIEDHSEPTVIDAIELVDMSVPKAYIIENTDNFEIILEENDILPRATDREENPFIVEIPEASTQDAEECFNSMVDRSSTFCENSFNDEEVLPAIVVSENVCKNMPHPALIDFTNYNSEDIHANVLLESCNKEESSWSDLTLNSHYGVTDDNTAGGFTDMGIFNDEQQSNGTGPTVTDDKNENFMAFGNCEDVIGMSYAEALVFLKTPDGNSSDFVEDVNIDVKNDVQTYSVHFERQILDEQINVIAVNPTQSSIPIYSVYDNAEFPDAVPSDEHYEKQDHEHEVDQHEETFHKIRHKRNKRRNKKNRKSSNNSENFEEDSPSKVYTEKPNYQQPEYHGRRRNSRRWRNSRAYYEAFHQPQQAQCQEYYRDSHWKYSDAKMD